MSGDETGGLDDHVEFALEVTNTVIWTINLDTGASERVHGPVESLYNLEERTGNAETFFANAVHPDDRPEVEQLYLKVLRDNTEVFETVYRTNPANGEIRWIENHGRVHSAAETRRLTGISTEITERKRRELELQEQNERLSDLASMLSHDFRNPLNVADGHLQLAQEEFESEHLNAIESAHTRLRELIEQLLARVEEGEPFSEEEFEPQQMTEIELASLARDCWANIDTKEASLLVETDLTIQADRPRVKQLFENLVRNAVEHCRPDVTVTVGNLPDARGFYVSDDGPGIPDSEAERVFERGYSTSEDGTGLGLYIVKEVVDAHGWTITATKSESGGARFEVADVQIP